jgi:hypothetical protein
VLVRDLVKTILVVTAVVAAVADLTLLYLLVW